ncbi:MAG TPA: hypothetical protein VD999_00640 [Vitreimonas sp.]|nr:hypothetical protein [Vitreimonas sp.]
MNETFALQYERGSVNPEKFLKEAEVLLKRIKDIIFHNNDLLPQNRAIEFSQQNVDVLFDRVRTLGTSYDQWDDAVQSLTVVAYDNLDKVTPNVRSAEATRTRFETVTKQLSDCLAQLTTALTEANYFGYQVMGALRNPTNFDRLPKVASVINHDDITDEENRAVKEFATKRLLIQLGKATAGVLTMASMALGADQAYAQVKEGDVAAAVDGAEEYYSHLVEQAEEYLRTAADLLKGRNELEHIYRQLERYGFEFPGDEEQGNGLLDGAEKEEEGPEVGGAKELMYKPERGAHIDAFHVVGIGPNARLELWDRLNSNDLLGTVSVTDAENDIVSARDLTVSAVRELDGTAVVMFDREGYKVFSIDGQLILIDVNDAENLTTETVFADKELNTVVEDDTPESPAQQPPAVEAWLTQDIQSALNTLKRQLRTENITVYQRPEDQLIVAFVNGSQVPEWVYDLASLSFVPRNTGGGAEFVPTSIPSGNPAQEAGVISPNSPAENSPHLRVNDVYYNQLIDQEVRVQTAYPGCLVFEVPTNFGKEQGGPQVNSIEWFADEATTREACDLFWTVTFRDLILGKKKNLEGQSYAQLLGVSENPTFEEVSAAYHAMRGNLPLVPYMNTYWLDPNQAIRFMPIPFSTAQRKFEDRTSGGWVDSLQIEQGDLYGVSGKQVIYPNQDVTMGVFLNQTDGLNWTDGFIVQFYVLHEAIVKGRNPNYSVDAFPESLYPLYDILGIDINTWTGTGSITIN